VNESVSGELRMQRLVATGLDWILITVVTLLVILATGVLEHAEDYANIGQSAVNAALCGMPAYLILNGWLLWTRGQTAGKAAMSLMIVDHHHDRGPPNGQLRELLETVVRPGTHTGPGNRRGIDFFAAVVTGACRLLLYLSERSTLFARLGRRYTCR